MLIHPLRLGNRDLAEQYSRVLLNAVNLTTLSVSPTIAASAAALRAAHGYRTPDAIQLAAAQHGGAATFLTNDDGITSITGLKVIMLDHLFSEP